MQAGTYSFNDERNRARLQDLKTFAGYWQPGALGIDINAATRLFVTGRAGMLIDGSWQYQTIKQDK